MGTTLDATLKRDATREELQQYQATSAKINQLDPSSRSSTTIRSFSQCAVHLLVGFISLCLLLFVAKPVFASCARLTYAQSQDSAYLRECRKGSTYTKDNNVWVYTGAMQRRFAMPKEWIDNDLQGAELVALSLEPVGRDRCHNEGESQKCVPSWEWMMEIYIDGSIDIGLEGGLEIEFVPWKSSLWYLGELNPGLKAQWEEKFSLKETSLEVADNSQSYSFKVIGYDKTRKNGLTIVTALLDSRAMDLPSVISRRIVFKKAGQIKHTVSLPSSFWDRAGNYVPNTKGLTAANWLGGQEKDNNLWACSAEFAGKYHLPEASIVREGLVGAMAVAYHIEPEGDQMCGFFSRQDACAPLNWGGLHDFYIEPEAELNYVDDQPMNADSSRGSSLFLHEQFAQNDFPLKPCQQNQWDRCWMWPSHFVKQVVFWRQIKNSKDTRWWHNAAGPALIIHPKAWNLPFHFLSNGVTQTDDPIGENYITYINGKEALKAESPFEDKRITHTVSLPSDYMIATQRIRALYEKQGGSVVDLVEKEYGWKKHPNKEADGSASSTSFFDRLFGK